MKSVKADSYGVVGGYVRGEIDIRVESDLDNFRSIEGKVYSIGDVVERVINGRHYKGVVKAFKDGVAILHHLIADGIKVPYSMQWNFGSFTTAK